VPLKPDSQSDHELITKALRLARALDAIAADRERRRDMTSMRERLLLAAWLRERPEGRPGRPIDERPR
jgi:hypothetical protein